MRISDWSSDVCSSDLPAHGAHAQHGRNSHLAVGAHPPVRRMVRGAEARRISPVAKGRFIIPNCAIDVISERRQTTHALLTGDETMAYWKLKGRELANCNCEYGCNCQFGGLPDKGKCQAVVGMAIDQGVHGDTGLSGLNIAAVFHWPGPIHEGNGECAAFVDERANEAQRNALLTIMTGGDTD